MLFEALNEKGCRARNSKYFDSEDGLKVSEFLAKNENRVECNSEPIGRESIRQMSFH